MIMMALGADGAQYPDLFDQASRLRHKVFVEEMGWEDLRDPTGRERDRFDDEHAVHQFALRDGKVAGYQRLLPTTRPHLLSEVLPHLCEGPLPCAPEIWEVSRYCVAPAWREGRRAVGSVGSELIAGAVEWGLGSGLTHFVYEFEPMWILRALQLQFMVRPLGLQSTVGSQQIIAAALGFTPRTLATIRKHRDCLDPVVELAGTLAERSRVQLAS